MVETAPSGYLRQVKPLLKTLLKELLEKYPYASILAWDSVERSFGVSPSGIQIGENPLLGSRGFCIKAFDGEGYAEHSFTTISEEAIPAIVSEVASLMAAAKQLPEGLARSRFSPLPDEPASFAKSSTYELDPAAMSEEEIIKKLSEIRARGKSLSDKLLDCSARFEWQRLHKLFLSRNKDMEQNLTYCTGGLVAIARRGQEVKTAGRGFSGICGGELLDTMMAGVEKAVRDTVDLLDSAPITPGEYDCVCTPTVTGMIVHEAFGHGVEMDMFVKDRALAKDFIGKRVASDLVTMHDGAAAADEMATFFFDDEGMEARDTVVIKNGILERGISDCQSAMLLGTAPTANGRRQGFDRKAYTRMTNTFFEGGHDKVEDMIASIEDGYLLDCPSSGMEDPKNWGIQCMVNIAREIKHGKLTGKIFSPIVLTGYVPDLLKSISMMSENVELSGSGFCGKGYKEWVRVSDGGPYIKARIKLG